MGVQQSNFKTSSSNSKLKASLKRFDAQELEVLKKVYKELSARSPTIGIDKETFLQYFPLPGFWGERLFERFCYKGNGTVDYDEFINGIAICCRGNKQDRIQVLFDVFDLNSDGFLQKSELVAMLSNLPNVMSYIWPKSRDEYKLKGFNYIPLYQNGTFNSSHNQLNHTLSSQLSSNHNENISQLEKSNFDKLNNSDFSDKPNLSFSRISSSNELQLAPPIFESDDDRNDSSSVLFPSQSIAGHIEKRSKVLEITEREKLLQAVKPINTSALAQSLIEKEIEEEKNEDYESVETLVDKIVEECEFVEYGQLSLLEFKTWLEKHEGLLNMFTECLHEEIWGLQGNALFRSTAPSSSALGVLQSRYSSPHSKTGFLTRRSFFRPFFKPSIHEDFINLTHEIRPEHFLKIKKLFSPQYRDFILQLDNKEFSVQAAAPSLSPTGNEFNTNVSTANILSNTTGLHISHKQTTPEPISVSTINRGSQNTQHNYFVCPMCHTTFFLCKICQKASPSLHLREGKIVLICNDCTNNEPHYFTNCWACKWSFQNCLELIDKSEPSKDGVLFKIGRHLHQWLARYFVLIDNVLYYYIKKDDLRPKGFLFLEGCYVEHVKLKMNSCKDGFSINHISDRVPQRVLFANNPADCQDWMDALRASMKQQSLDHIYYIKEKIGCGKFSVVYRGIHKESGKAYAIKVIEKKKTSQRDQELLRSEISILRLLHYPTVISFKEILDTKERLYISMELVEGGELFDLLLKNHRLSEHHTHRIISQLISTVAYLHKCGIMHRDIKPENILLIDHSQDSLIKLTDFGLSTLCCPNQKLYEPCGTLVYVAPEVLTLQGYDHKVDVWSIGVVMYLLLRGKIPFPLPKNLDMNHIQKHFKMNFEGKVWRFVSESAKDLIHKMLQPDPSRRISAAEALEHIWIRNPTAVISDNSQINSFNNALLDENNLDFIDEAITSIYPDPAESTFVISNVAHTAAKAGFNFPVEIKIYDRKKDTRDI